MHFYANLRHPPLFDTLVEQPFYNGDKFLLRRQNQVVILCMCIRVYERLV